MNTKQEDLRNTCAEAVLQRYPEAAFVSDKLEYSQYVSTWGILNTLIEAKLPEFSKPGMPVTMREYHLG